MYYEINVSLNGKHFFAIAERSINSEAKMKEMYELFAEKFPEAEGYKIDVTKWEHIGKPIILKNENVEA